MGFRFRKSISLGKHFKINLSKSGVGFSAGVKGFRVTRTANGKIRKTVTVPGTGISYVDESNGLGLGIVDDLLSNKDKDNKKESVKKTSTKKKSENKKLEEEVKVSEKPLDNIEEKEEKAVFTLKTNYVEKE